MPGIKAAVGCGCYYLLSKLDLVTLGDVQPAPRPQIVNQASLAQELRHQVEVLVIDYQSQQLDQVRVS